MPSGFFALLDDIAYLMDDIATASKIATKKTALILGDDLAVGAKKTLGVQADREIPIILAIVKGSLINKAIILPLMFFLEYFMPFIIKPLLLIGGTYLSFEGAENIIKFFKKEKKQKKTMTEKEKIKSAILTDFVLSLEIVIISLSTVLDKPLLIQIAAVTVASLFATAGVYGVVTLIIRMDDIGIFLVEKYDGFMEKIGLFLIKLLPKTIKAISVIGTIAMILVGGGIYLHNIGFLHRFSPAPFIAEGIIGLVVGFSILGVVKLFRGIMHS